MDETEDYRPKAPKGLTKAQQKQWVRELERAWNWAYSRREDERVRVVEAARRNARNSEAALSKLRAKAERDHWRAKRYRRVLEEFVAFAYMPKDDREFVREEAERIAARIRNCVT